MQIDEGSTTVGHRLSHMPKILMDFAVRGLELPQSWVPFLSGISTHHHQVTPSLFDSFVVEKLDSLRDAI